MKSKIKIIANENSYRGVDVDKESVIYFKHTFSESSSIEINNFIGCIHGLMHIKKTGINADVYINDNKLKEKIEKKQLFEMKKQIKNEDVLTFFNKCTMWLIEQKSGVDIYLY